MIFGILLLLLIFCSIIELSLEVKTSSLSKISNNEYEGFFYEKAIPFPMEIHFEAEINKNRNKTVFEIVFSKEKNNEVELYNNSYILRFTLSKDKVVEDSIKIIKCLEERKECSSNEEKMLKMKSADKMKPGDILYDLSVSVDDVGIKIISKNDLIFEDKIKLKNYFKEEFYFKIIGLKKQIEFKDIYLKMNSNETKHIRFLEGEGNLVHLEMAPENILTKPNYLKEGNVYVIPRVILNPKDENGKFPSKIVKYKYRDLQQLVNVTHSKNSYCRYMVSLCNEKIILSFETKIPGELYITSNYFKNIDKYIIKISNGEINVENTKVLRIEEQLLSENTFRFIIIPKDKYGNLFYYMEKSDLDKFEITIKYPDNISKSEEVELIFDQNSKEIIFDKNLTMAGETIFEFKINNKTIECNNNTINVKYSELDYNNSNIEYNKEIQLGENIILLFSPRDKYNNIIPANEIIDILQIDCKNNNKTNIKFNSSLNEEKNSILFTNEEIITRPGNLTLILTYNNNSSTEFIVNVIEKVIINNTKFYIKTNISTEEINNTITADVKNYFEIIVNLRNLFGDELQYKDDSIEIKEAKLYGNDMDMIFFDQIRNENTFNLIIPENRTEDFRYLVSGTNYSMEIQFLNGSEIINFYFDVNLISPENDEGYGNGIYNSSHFTIVPNETQFKIPAGTTFTFYLEIRTKKDLLYHKELDINSHLNYNLSAEDQSFTFNASKVNSSLGIFTIDLYGKIQSENELTLIFDNEEFEKILIKFDSNPLPNAQKSELLNYTKEINEDIEPITLSLILRDVYNNEFIDKKEIVFKKQLFVMNGNEKPEQNIELGADNKTFIINFVSNYHQDSFNLSVVFNNSNDLIPIKNNITVKVKVQEFLEPEELVVPINYKTGSLFLYRNVKAIVSKINVDEEVKNLQLEANVDFLLYIRDINYEKGEDGNKLILYTGYLAILKLSNKNFTTNEDDYFIYDKKLINIYNNFKNNSKENNTNVTEVDSSGFIKIDFYENGKIKQMYYPKKENFIMRSMDYIKEITELIIPKISAKLFTSDIYNKLNNILKENDEEKNQTDSITNERDLLLRRLSELTPKKKKIIDKIKKYKIRILSDNSTEELETEIIPFEKDIDVQLRQLDDNGDNTNNITLLSYEDVTNDKAKLTGSLDKKEVFTNINEKGIVSSIYESQNTQLVSGVKDEAQDRYIKEKAYNNTFFEEDTFKIENETELQGEQSIYLNNMDSNNTNIINLIDDFTDENGTFIEYFSDTEYEIYNESVYEKYLLENMGTDYLDAINVSSNLSVSITDEYEVSTDSLRYLESNDNDYPFYGQEIARNVKDVYSKEILGLTMKTYIETTYYPHNGKTVSETLYVIGSQKSTISKQTTISNSYILARNKNHMTNELMYSLQNIKKYVKTEFDSIFNDNFNPFENNYEEKLAQIDNSFNNLTNMFEYIIDPFIKARDALNLDTLQFIDNLKNIWYKNIDKSSILHDRLSEVIKEDSKEYVIKIKNIAFNLYNEFTEFLYNIYWRKMNDITFDIEDSLVLNEIYEDIKFRASSINKNLNFFSNNIYYFLDFLDKGIFQDFKNNYQEKRKIYVSRVQKFIEEIESMNNLNYYFIDEYRYYFSNIVDDTSYNSFFEYVGYLISFLSGDDFSVKRYIGWGGLETKLKEFFNNYEKKLSYIPYINEINSFMKEDLEIIYAKLNDFSQFINYVSNETYYRIINIKYTFLDDLIDINNKLSNISNMIFKYINISSEDLDNNNLNSIKENITALLMDYNMTFSNFLNGHIFENYLKKNKPIFQIDISYYENIIKDLIETKIPEIMNNNLTDYLVYPDKLLDSIDFFEKYLIEAKEMIQYLENNTDSFIQKKVFPNILDTIGKYLYNFIENDLEGQLSIINNESSIFFTENLKEEKTLFDNLITHLRMMVYYYVDPEEFDLFQNETFIKYFYGDTMNSSLENILTYYNEKMPKLKNDLISKYNSTNNGKFENERHRFEQSLEEMYIRVIKNYTDLLGSNLDNIINDYDKNTLLIMDKELDYAEKFYYKKNNEILNESLCNYYQNNSNSIYLLLDQRIQMLLDNYELNYTDIVEEYKKIMDWTENSFIEYFNEYYNTINASIDYLIEEYFNSLYSSVNLYPYQIYNGMKAGGGMQKIQNFLQNLEENVTSQFESTISKIEKYISGEERFNDYFLNKTFEKLQKKKNDFLNNINGSIEFEIGKEKFTLSEYFSKKMEEIDNKNKINDFNNISNYAYTQFINTIKTLFAPQFNYLKTKLINGNNEFLDYFFAHQCKTTTCSKNTKNYKKSKNNNKDCWSIRGLFYSDIYEKQTKIDQKYQNYINQMSLIDEKCKVDGKIDTENCPYDLSDIEEVEYKNLTALYYNCQKTVNFPKFSLFESSEDLDLSTINSIFNKINKKINKYWSFEDITKNYIYKKFYMNNYKQILRESQLNITEIKEQISSENTKFTTAYKNLLGESITKTIDNIYYGYGSFGNGILGTQQKYNLIIFYKLKRTLFEKYYFDRYKDQFDIYKDCIEKIQYAGQAYKKNLLEFFNGIKENLDDFSMDFYSNIDGYIENYYGDDNKNDSFMKQITNHSLEFVQKYFIEEFNIPFLEENLDNILNDTFFNYNLTVIINKIKDLFELLYFDISEDLGEDNDNGDIGGEINPDSEPDNGEKDFETQLTELNDYINSLPERPVNMSNTSVEFNNSYHEYLNKYLKVEDECLKNISEIVKPVTSPWFNIFEDVVNFTTNVSKLEAVYGEFFKDGSPSLNKSEISKDFFTDIKNYYTPIFKQMYSDLNEFVENINEKLNNTIEKILDDINAAIGGLVGYTMIDGFNYIERPCSYSYCYYTLNISSFKDILKKHMKNNRRALEEKEEDNQELKKLISNAKKSLHKYNGSNPFDYKEKNDPLIKLRKLTTFTPYSFEEYENYNSKTGARGELHLNVSLTYLESEIDSQLGLLYSHIRDLEEKVSCDNFFWTLTIFKDNIYYLLSRMKFLLDADSYKFLEKTLIKNYNNIYTFLSKAANLLKSNGQEKINKLKDSYLYIASMKDNINSFVLTNFHAFNDVIGTKSASYEETETYEEPANINEILEQDRKKNTDFLQKIFDKVVMPYVNFTKSFFSFSEGNDTEAKNFEGYLEFDVEEDDNGQFKSGYFTNWNEKDEDEKDDDSEPETFGETLEKLKDKMKKDNIKLESEISFDFKNWSAIYFETKTGLHKEWEKEKHWGYQYPFIFPPFPALQLRVGIQFRIYIKLIVGVDIIVGTDEKGFKSDVRGLIDLTIGAKLDAFAEAGLYGGIAEIAGGISGTLVDARCGFRILISIGEQYVDLYAYLTISAFQFRVYVEARVNLIFWKGKAKLFDKTFGLKEPLFTAEFYIRYNMFGEFDKPDKGIKSVFKK